MTQIKKQTGKAEERREYKGRRLASSAAHTMLSRLGAILIVGLLALALGVNGEAAPCASVLKAGKFRRGEAESAVVKRCEEDSTSTTTRATTTTTEPVNCACCNRFIGPVSESQPTFFNYWRGHCRNPIDKLQDSAYVTLTCGLYGSDTHNYKYYEYDTGGRLLCFTVESADLLNFEIEQWVGSTPELKQCALWDEDEEECIFL